MHRKVRPRRTHAKAYGSQKPRQSLGEEREREREREKREGGQGHRIRVQEERDREKGKERKNERKLIEAAGDDAGDYSEIPRATFSMVCQEWYLFWPVLRG